MYGNLYFMMNNYDMISAFKVWNPTYFQLIFLLRILHNGIQYISNINDSRYESIHFVIHFYHIIYVHETKYCSQSVIGNIGPGTYVRWFKLPHHININPVVVKVVIVPVVVEKIPGSLDNNCYL